MLRSRGMLFVPPPPRRRRRCHHPQPQPHPPPEAQDQLKTRSDHVIGNSDTLGVISK